MYGYTQFRHHQWIASPVEIYFSYKNNMKRTYKSSMMSQGHSFHYFTTHINYLANLKRDVPRRVEISPYIAFLSMMIEFCMSWFTKDSVNNIIFIICAIYPEYITAVIILRLICHKYSCMLY